MQFSPQEAISLPVPRTNGLSFHLTCFEGVYRVCDLDPHCALIWHFVGDPQEKATRLKLAKGHLLLATLHPALNQVASQTESKVLAE